MMRPGCEVRHTLLVISIAIVCGLAVEGCTSPALQLFSRGEELLYRNKFVQADSLFTEYIALDPSDGIALYNRALARTGIGDLRNAITDLDRAVELVPGNLDARWLRFRVRELWVGQLRADTSGPALTRPLRASMITALQVIQIEEMNALLRYDPSDGVARCERAILYRTTGRMEEAEADLTFILRSDPRDVRALTERGNLFHALLRYDEALRDYGDAMGECDTCRWLLYNTALSLQAAGRLTEAGMVLENLVAADSMDGDAWFLLGECRFALHRIRAACDAWERSLGLGIEEARGRITSHCMSR